MNIQFKNEEQEGNTGLVRVLVPVGGGEYKERVQEGKGSGNIVCLSMKMEQ
jgi:hypothetical protein